MIQASDLQQKYAFLLQPIKDLTKNFEVDLFNVLQEYITDLENMEFTLEDGKTLNFAEAAMLIQGTACVWGRKVEYLHKLVSQTLDMLANKKKSCKDKNDDVEEDINKDEESFEDDDIKFLSLNDEKISGDRIPKSHNASVKPLPTAATVALEIKNSNRGTALERQGENDNIYHIRDFVAVCATAYRDSVSMLEGESDSKEYFTMKTAPLATTARRTPTIPTEMPKPVPEEMEDQAPEPFEDDYADNLEDDRNDSILENQPMNGEHTVNIHAMNLRKPKQVYQESTLESAIELLDEHTFASKEYASKPFRKGKTVPPDSKRKNVKKEIPFIYLSVFDNNKKFSKLGKSIKYCLGEFAQIEMSRIAVINNQIKKEIKMAEIETKYKDDFPLENDLPKDEYDDNHNDDTEDYNDDYNGVMGLIEDNQAKENEGEIESVPLTYEELVQQSVKKFYQEALRYKQDNALGKRVREWEERVVPLLKEQNSRPEFDIHECGDKMVSSFESCGEEKLFASCVRDCRNDWEICRLFAATLQLANDGNFFISKDDNINSMKLKLLSKHRLRERLNDYGQEPLDG